MKNNDIEILTQFIENSPLKLKQGEKMFKEMLSDYMAGITGAHYIIGAYIADAFILLVLAGLCLCLVIDQKRTIEQKKEDTISIKFFVSVVVLSIVIVFVFFSFHLFLIINTGKNIFIYQPFSNGLICIHNYN